MTLRLSIPGCWLPMLPPQTESEPYWITLKSSFKTPGRAQVKRRKKSAHLLCDSLTLQHSLSGNPTPEISSANFMALEFSGSMFPGGQFLITARFKTIPGWSVCLSSMHVLEPCALLRAVSRWGCHSSLWSLYTLKPCPALQTSRSSLWGLPFLYIVRTNTLLFDHEHLKPNVSARVFEKKRNKLIREKKKNNRSKKVFFFSLSNGKKQGKRHLSCFSQGC